MKLKKLYRIKCLYFWFVITACLSFLYLPRQSCDSRGHVTRSNFSCNLQRNKRCVASCKKKFTCNTPFCNCNCCVASCKKRRTTLYFSQRCELSCLRVTSPLQLATHFVRMDQSELIFRKMSATQRVRHLVCYLYALQVAKKFANV